MKFNWLGKKTKTDEGTNLTNTEIVKKIQNRAFALYEKRGYSHGNDWADWFKAQQEVAKELKLKKLNLN